MTLDNKEDLRIRMIDLENKLAESEEERSKLEKTCNALIKALREEEKMRYNVLNKKYEKFLQDCTVRKRRNDIIMRSLCRIEDRSRALFAKTERLKLLKDRYISYLKINESKNEVTSALEFPFSTSSARSNNDVSSSSIRWKIPLTNDHEMKKLEENLLASHGNTDFISKRLSSSMIQTKPEMYLKKNMEEFQDNEEEKNSERILLNKPYHDEVPVLTSTIKDKLNLSKTKLVLNETLESPFSVPFKNEELVNISNHKKSESGSPLKSDIRNRTELSGSTVGHQEAIGKLKNVLSLEQYLDNERCDQRQDGYVEKMVDRDESYEKDSVKNQNNTDVTSSGINHSLGTFCSKVTTQGKFELKEGHAEKEVTPHQVGPDGSLPKPQKNAKSPPMGLDGIDYQDETYPESYYEQPVHHHNRTSIVADVILEEDETEPDGEEEEKHQFPESDFRQNQFFPELSHESIWERESGNRVCNESGSNSENENADVPEEVEPLDDIKSQKLDSEKSSEAEQSDATTGQSKSGKSENLGTDKSGRSKPPIKSNLLHLLESDSESFQIEHGDVPSENEGSDFDFSIH